VTTDHAEVAEYFDFERKGGTILYTRVTDAEVKRLVDELETDHATVHRVQWGGAHAALHIRSERVAATAQERLPADAVRFVID
jgi:hypothetical protein